MFKKGDYVVYEENDESYVARIVSINKDKRFAKIIVCLNHKRNPKTQCICGSFENIRPLNKDEKNILKS